MSNEPIKLSIDGYTEKVVPKQWNKISVRELHIIMVNPPEEGDTKEKQYKKIILPSETMF